MSYLRYSTSLRLSGAIGDSDEEEDASEEAPKLLAPQDASCKANSVPVGPAVTPGTQPNNTMQHSEPSAATKSHSSAESEKFETVKRLVTNGNGSSVEEGLGIEVLFKVLKDLEGWTEEEVNEDLDAFKKYRIKTVGNLRVLSSQSWLEMKNIQPITKDVLKKAVGWKA